MFFENLYKSIIRLGLALLLFTASSTNVYTATTQGAPDFFASTGTVDIIVTSGDLIRIFGNQTVSFGTWSIGDPDLANDQNICIGKTSTGTPYGIEASGDGDPINPSAFTITNGTDLLYYDVFWNDAPNTTGQIQLLPGTTVFGQTGSAFSFFFNLIFGGFNNFPCGFFLTPPNANLEIEIPASRLSAAAGGFYQGTLTLLVIPQ